MTAENGKENESPVIRGAIPIRVIFSSARINVEHQQSALKQHLTRPLGEPRWPLGKPRIGKETSCLFLKPSS